MTKGETLIKIARDEAQTIAAYLSMVRDTSDMDPETQDLIDEIISDEFNHCIIATVAASKALGIEIAPDDISPDPNDIKVE